MDFNSLKDCVVLYVEDEKAVRDQTCIILKDFVKEVYLASNGEEGLNIALQKDVDIIVTDILMPHMNGIEMLKKLKTDYNRSIPAIITTAFTETNYLLEAITLKVDGFIMKPINMKDLISAIYTAMLPKLHNKEIQGCAFIIEGLAALIGGKKIEILKYIINHLDEDKIFNGSYQDIIDNIGVSKPTVVHMFQQLIKVGILEKVKNKVYRFRNTKLVGD
ncbi:response regulator [Sulfurospirillum deleyianum]|uniref:Response regulator receiver n=1 Tax=Sulfurospirillum deleyianum (strain ATCC 51133 / DSM 6946 / 5175) TaxID=525898 RepID=D1AZ06_SULD5|nr:response regulator [Sulfurospirillum deleyianum]ACZ11144.1 response regulator receiver [Sulfurospirillum deleyianum DSM 6946]